MVPRVLPNGTALKKWTHVVAVNKAEASSTRIPFHGPTSIANLITWNAQNLQDRKPNLVGGVESLQPSGAQPLGELRVLLLDEEQEHGQRTLRQEVGRESGPQGRQLFRSRDGNEGVERAAVPRLFAGLLLVPIDRREGLV